MDNKAIFESVLIRGIATAINKMNTPTLESVNNLILNKIGYRLVKIDNFDINKPTNK